MKSASSTRGQVGAVIRTLLLGLAAAMVGSCGPGPGFEEEEPHDDGLWAEEPPENAPATARFSLSAATLAALTGTDCPFNPATLERVCGPFRRPAVFFAAHPDDETIGMAGAIREHILAGRPVFVELLTHGTTTGVRQILANKRGDGWHGDSHTFELSPEDIGQARVREFLQATTRLGVTGVRLSNFSPRGALTRQQVATRVNWWRARGGAGLSLKGPAGRHDALLHPEHIAVWDALVASDHPDVRGYLVYAFATPGGSPTRTENISAHCAAKRHAMGAYRIWQPQALRFAVGYHSTRELFDNAARDCREFLVVP